MRSTLDLGERFYLVGHATKNQLRCRTINVAMRSYLCNHRLHSWCGNRNTLDGKHLVWIIEVFMHINMYLSIVGLCRGVSSYHNKAFELRKIIRVPTQHPMCDNLPAKHVVLCCTLRRLQVSFGLVHVHSSECSFCRNWIRICMFCISCRIFWRHWHVDIAIFGHMVWIQLSHTRMVNTVATIMIMIVLCAPRWMRCVIASKYEGSSNDADGREMLDHASGRTLTGRLEDRTTVCVDRPVPMYWGKRFYWIAARTWKLYFKRCGRFCRCEVVMEWILAMFSWV